MRVLVLAAGRLTGPCRSASTPSQILHLGTQNRALIRGRSGTAKETRRTSTRRSSTGEMIMSGAIPFDVKFVPAGTGSAVWDDPYVDQLIHRFMPHDRKHGPMLGVLQMGAARPTPGVLRNLVVTVGEDVKAGRYGSFSWFICSEDEDTRSVIGDVAASRNVALFVCSSSEDLEDAEPVGVLTAKDRETLRLVSQAGGTVTALDLAEQVNIEKTAAGNRLVSLQRKGYLQRVEQPHPAGDLFVDPRSVHLT